MERTWIYVLSSVVVSLLGVVLLLAKADDPKWVSIATSLVAAGLASVSFAVIRFFDDREVRRSADEIRQNLSELTNHALAQGNLIDGLRRNLALAASSEGRVFDRHPEDEVGELVDSHNGRLEVDAMGLTLRPFVRDQYERLLSRDDIRVRLLIQHPGRPSFAEVCEQESRDRKRMVEEAISVTRQILSTPRSDKRTFDVRWFTESPTVTMTRVGEVMYVRPRFFREAHQGRVFYERYMLEEGAPFHIYREHFVAAWDSAMVPTAEECDRIVAESEAPDGGRSVTQEPAI